MAQKITSEEAVMKVSNAGYIGIAGFIGGVVLTLASGLSVGSESGALISHNTPAANAPAEQGKAPAPQK